jgi:hypothetical protein
VASNDDLFDAKVRQSFHDTSEQTIGSAFERLLEATVHLDAL